MNNRSGVPIRRFVGNSGKRSNGTGSMATVLSGFLDLWLVLFLTFSLF